MSMEPVTHFRNVIVATDIKNVGKDKDRPIVPVRVVYNGKYRDRSGAEVKTTSYFPVVFYGRMAELMLTYGRKGLRLNIDCEPKEERFKDKDGKNRSVTSFKVNKFEILTPKSECGHQNNSDAGARRPDDDPEFREAEKDFAEDDIPF